jgi:hypothetical protein
MTSIAIQLISFIRIKPMFTFGPNEQYPFAFFRILVKSNSFKFEFLDFRISLYKLFMFTKISIFSLVLPFCHLKL